MMARPRSHVILVLGMHRSGTSVSTGALHLLGVEMSANLMRAHADNPKGYWEHIEIVELHDELLAALGSRWDDALPLPAGWESDPRVEPFRARLREIVHRDFGAAPLWALKDPRLCRLLPLWLPLLREMDCEPRCLLVARDPRAVARSIVRRDGFLESKALLLTLDYLCTAEHDSRQCRRAFLLHDALLSDPVAALQKAGATLDLQWPVPIADAAAALRQFVDKGLVTPASTSAPAPLHPWLALAHGALAAAAEEGRDPQPAFDELRRQMEAARALFLPEIETETQDLRRQIAALSDLAAGAQSTRRQLHELHLEHTAVRADRNAKNARLKQLTAELATCKAEAREQRAENKAIRRSLGWKLLRACGLARASTKAAEPAPKA